MDLMVESGCPLTRIAGENCFAVDEQVVLLVVGLHLQQHRPNNHQGQFCGALDV